MNDQKKFDALSFAIACGVTYSSGILFLLILMRFGWGTEVLPFIQAVYKGTNITLGGTILGVIWTFIDGFIGGGIFALIYNFLIDKISKK